MVEEGVSLGQGIAGVGGDPVAIPTSEAGRGGAAGWRCVSSPWWYGEWYVAVE